MIQDSVRCMEMDEKMAAKSRHMEKRREVRLTFDTGLGG